MTLDIRGSLKNTKLSSNKYIVLEELISNSIEAFLIRKHQEKSALDCNIKIRIDIFPADLLGDQLDLSISCTDNGCGLGEDQTKAFLTKDTSYKDDLAVAGIGKCRGAGRIQFFHHFSLVGIASTYRSGTALLKRVLAPHEGRKIIDFVDFTTEKGDESEIGTTITLANLKPSVRNAIYAEESLAEIFSAESVKRYMLMALLQRLVSLKPILGDFEISFETKYAKTEKLETTTLKKSDLPVVSTTRDIAIEERDPKSGHELGRQQFFKLSHYKLDAAVYDLPKNAISLCAKSSPVQDVTSRYLRTRTEQNNAISGFHHLVLIEGDVFDRRVNEQRDGFDGIPAEIPSGDMFSDETVSYQAIYEKIDPIIDELVAPADWNKDVILKDVAETFGVSAAMLADTETRVRYGDSAKSVAERALKKYQDRIISETAEILSLKQEIVNSEPDSEEFRRKINELSWKYTAALKNFDMAHLSQLVVRRAAIVEILSLACAQKLLIQKPSDNRRKDERLIHSVFFPMRKDSLDVPEHDIWLLSEEYQYYDYISSDKPLSQIEWSNGVKLFEGNIDKDFDEILKRRIDENGAKRPDIAVFSKEGSAIIIEFKAPGVHMDDHVNDLYEYAHLLAAKSNGRLRKFYGYLIGDSLNPLRMGGWTRFPTGKGFFNTYEVRDPETPRVLGELYAETLFFEDVVERARKRIAVYQQKLQIDLTKR
ncbi:hypothetical protein [Falsiroseomonas oryzae]|uniref:hypothetical protein n=1 Tax=Falsiroseomonas oryzae TaxID=2766473 RepID=UPI0022EB0376|nr:hypothetical protein [Roseomonas sp. MO-31]